MKTKLILLVAACAVVMLLTVPVGCSSPASPTPTPTASVPSPGGAGGAVINSDSIVTAQIQAIRKQTTGYPWEVDILVQSSVDVGNLPNPTKDSISKVITVKTDQDMTAYKTGQSITAKVKYVGDVPRPGITLYLYNIAPLITP